MFNNYFHSRFIEDLFLVDPKYSEDYYSRILYGFETMKQSSITIGILARDLEEILPFSLARLHSLGSLFGSYKLIAYENDSVDRTKEILRDSVDVLISEQKNWIINEQDKSSGRRERMSYYRNSLRNEMIKLDSDYYMVYDADILGGFSYEGIANSISYKWDVCGSNSFIYDEHQGDIRRLYYDSWAYRHFGQRTEENIEEINKITMHRGEPIIRVNSCFGGLALYRPLFFKNQVYKYTAEDCDHVTLHLKMVDDGAMIVVNPSQIVVYNETRYLKR